MSTLGTNKIITKPEGTDILSLGALTAALQTLEDVAAHGIAVQANTSTTAYTTSFPLQAFVNGMRLMFIPRVANTGAVTINFNGLGAKKLLNSSGVQVSAAGTFEMMQPWWIEYDSTLDSGNGAWRGYPGASISKLNGIEAGAQVNNDNFSTVKIGATLIEADAVGDTLELAAGANITLAPDVNNDKVTIAVTGVVQSSHIGTGGAEHANATIATAGFQSGADKTKLDGIQAGAEVNQNAISSIKVYTDGVEQTQLDADNKTDTIAIQCSSFIAATTNAPSDVLMLKLGLPYYNMQANFAGVSLANFLADQYTTNCGMIAAPKGGFTWTGSRDVAYVTAFSMRIRNVTAGTVVKSIKYAVVDDDLHYQIDAGAITLAVDGPASNATFNVSIPTGDHTIRFYLLNTTGSSCMDIIGDFLDNDIKWIAGGLYY